MDIQVYIFYRGEKIPICSECWSRICGSDLEWGGDEAEAFKRFGEVAAECTR